MPSISQLVNELVISPLATANVKFSQLVVEVARLPSDENALFTQLAVEVVRSPTEENLYFTQLVIELPTIGSGPSGSQVPFWQDSDSITSDAVAFWCDTELQ